MMLRQAIYRLDDAKRILAKKRAYIVAGSAEALNELPKGHWIGGTASSVMSGRGPMVKDDVVQITTLPGYISRLVIKSYEPELVESIYDDCPEHGLTLVIAPAGSEVYERFALNAANSERSALHPLAGWVAGGGSEEAAVFFGPNTKGFSNKLVAMHMELPADLYAEVNFINPFVAVEGAVIEFLEDGFVCRDALVNGRETNLAAYFEQLDLLEGYPLVADYSGSLLNVGVTAVEPERGVVTFDSPVLTGVKYRLSSLAGESGIKFQELLSRVDRERVLFSCSSVFNAHSGELGIADLLKEESEKLKGPLTAGEIAYRTQSQTYTYVLINELKRG